jgi:hypothetical protein
MLSNREPKNLDLVLYISKLTSKNIEIFFKNLHHRLILDKKEFIALPKVL